MVGAMDDGFAPIVLLLLLGSALAVGTTRLGLGALPAYLIAGAACGPGFMSLIDEQQVAHLAGVGAALLLFALGLDMDLTAMGRRLRTVGTASAIQVTLTIVIVALAAMVLGMPGGQGLALGACLAMSSSLLILRALDEHHLRGKEEGQMALGISLAQDVALGPLLVGLSFVLPLGPRPPLWLMSLGIVGLLAGTMLLRLLLIPVILARVRQAQVSELQVALAVGVALGAAWATNAVGLGGAVGAFCAGLAFGRDRQSVAPAVEPLKGLTAIFFFAATGLLFSPTYVVGHPLTVVGMLIGTIFVKSVIAGLALRVVGMSVRSAIGCGLLLGNVGEFSIILAGNLFSGTSDPALIELHQLILTTCVLSFLCMPGITWLAGRFLPRPRSRLIEAYGETVVIAGLGPVGNTVVQTLRAQGLPLMLVDRNEHLLSPWQGVDGIRCYQGRIEDMDDWLPTLGHRPGLVVLTYPIADTSALIAGRLRDMDPGLVIVARAPYEAQIATLERAGVRYVICDERETARALLPLLQRALLNAAQDPEYQRTRATQRTLQRLAAVLPFLPPADGQLDKPPPEP
jgi:CPA2 family monovalent cation:H+ antiporter-2